MTLRRTLSTGTGTMTLTILGLGAGLFYAPLWTLGFFGALAFCILLTSTTGHLPLWQKLGLAGLAGNVILSYGFANWSLFQTPVPVGYALLLTGTALAVGRRTSATRLFLGEPAIRWWGLLLGLTILHLLIDIPRYDMRALRDASFVLDGIFMLYGFLWARRMKSSAPLLSSLGLIFLLNTAYALTYPQADTLQAASPVSGIFLPVPLLGFYVNMPLCLAAGALFCLLVVPHVTRWPRVVVLGLTALQIGWSFVFESRAIYLGASIVVVLLVLLGGIRGGKVVVVLAGGVAAFFLIIGLGGAHLQGRIGPVDPTFLWEHAGGILLHPDAPEEQTVQWRVDLLVQVWQSWTANVPAMLLGEGFGLPLTDEGLAGGVIVRQPHNTHVTVLARLGIVGFFFWLMLQWSLLVSLLRALRSSPRAHGARDVALWFVLFYVLAMTFTTFQPWLEFSYGGVPFYMLMGFALGMWPAAEWARPRAFRSAPFVPAGFLGAHTQSPSAAPQGIGS